LDAIVYQQKDIIHWKFEKKTIRSNRLKICIQNMIETPMLSQFF